LGEEGSPIRGGVGGIEFGRFPLYGRFYWPQQNSQEEQGNNLLTFERGKSESWPPYIMNAKDFQILSVSP